MEKAKIIDFADEQRKRGMRMLVEVATDYAHEHGLEVQNIGWSQIAEDQFLMAVETENQSVTVTFSADEIEDFPSGEGRRYTKKKIRDKFASLSM